MKKFISILFFLIVGKSILAFSPVGTYVLFQPNSQMSYLHFLRFDTNGRYVYYEFTISNERVVSISLSDSIFGKWFVYENKIYLFSRDYLEAESIDEKNIYRILPYKSLVGDSLQLTIVDDCTLSHPDIYRQFKCVDVIFPDSLDEKLMFSIINNITIDERKKEITLPDNPEGE